MIYKYYYINIDKSLIILI